MLSNSAQTTSLTKLRGKISWICQAVRWLAVVWLAWILTLILLPLTDLAGLVGKINKSPELAAAPITVENLMASRSVNLLVWAVATLIGIALWRLMSGYLQGDIFSEEAATRLRRVGQAALLTTIVNVALRPLTLWFMSPTLFQSADIRAYFVPDDLLYVLISALILSLASVYAAAAEINAENKQFV